MGDLAQLLFRNLCRSTLKYFKILFQYCKALENVINHGFRLMPLIAIALQEGACNQNDFSSKEGKLNHKSIYSGQLREAIFNFQDIINYSLKENS